MKPDCPAFVYRSRGNRASASASSTRGAISRVANESADSLSASSSSGSSKAISVVSVSASFRRGGHILRAADRLTDVPQVLEDLFRRRVLWVTGKGGVGKSSVSAALALLAAERGLR